MRCCIDIEADKLIDPTQIWVICCKNIDTGEYNVFRNPTSDCKEAIRFEEFSRQVRLYIGHNFLQYDYPVLNRLLRIQISDIASRCIDTLIISKLVNYSRSGHSIEAYGIEFNFPKGKNFIPEFFSKWSQELEDYCVRDVDICHKIYLHYLDIIESSSWDSAIRLEHDFQLVVNDLHNNGFSFNSSRARKLLKNVEEELHDLDTQIASAFPPKLRPVREIHPKLTQHNTLHRGDFRWVKGGDLSEFNGGPFTRCSWEEFNPSSHKQIVSILSAAGWSPTDKTQTHIDTERELNRLKYSRKEEKAVDLTSLRGKLEILKISGWKINEQNISSLPPDAPAPARSLAKRILLESRRRTLTEWLGLVHPQTERVHGSFYGLGAWSGRMSHQKPNTANIPLEFKEDGSRKLLGKELRSLWQAPRNRLLVGVDAEGIQLRIFAHYIEDEEFTNALVKGRKEDKTDPHNLNQRVIGSVCKSRQAAKRFIYALLLGAGLWKLAQILECSEGETKQALDRLLERYVGWKSLKEQSIPRDGRNGYFIGLDGRKVPIPGETLSERKHLAMSGYLQNGESIIIKKAATLSIDEFRRHKAKLVDIVHDEYVIEVPNNMELAEHIQKTVCDNITKAGEFYNLKCPLAGSGNIGLNWHAIH